MAVKETNVLRLKFKTAEDKDKTINFPYADPEVTAANVKALSQACVTNGTIWATVPVSATSAVLITTTSTDISLA